METIPKSLGRTLRERRRKLGLSQSKVAELTGKTQPQIARMEQGLGEPSFSSVVEVARSLGTELVAIPVRLLPTVRSLLSSFDRDTPVKNAYPIPDSDTRDKDRHYRVDSLRTKDARYTVNSEQDKNGRRRLVGNDPDDAPDEWRRS